MTPNMPGAGPSTLPQTNQGGQRPTASQMHYEMPPWPQILYITSVQLSMISTILRAQGLYPADATVQNDAGGWGLPPSMGENQFYSLYWRGENGMWQTDQLGLTYHYYMDRAVAAQRVGNPPPRMVRRGDDGSIGFA